MEVAAVASFAILALAWILAPDRPRTVTPTEAPRREAHAEREPIAA